VDLSKETQARVISVLAAPDLNAVSLGEKHMFTAAGAIVWVAAAGLEVAARVAAVARPMTNPNNITPVISRVCAASKARAQYEDVSASNFLKGFLFSGGPMPKLESARGKAENTKKRARPLDKDYRGITELGHSPINSDVVGSGFGHLDL
jgi:hypothetical protein